MKNKLLTAQLFLCLLTFGLSVFGAFQNFSSVPYWDMWHGTLDFYSKAQAGDISVWWAQHNEHRIVLARVFFWLDNRLFGGLNIFLIIVNFLCIAAASIVFWVYLKAANKIGTDSFARVSIWIFITTWLFSWAQHENLIWGFQSQFFLAYLLPLAALFALAKSTEDSTRFLFPIACLLGVLSALSMTNGILALPLMLCFSLLTRQEAKRSFTLFIVSIATIAAYLYDYHSVGHHGHITSALKEDPLGFTQYVFRYIGCSFFYLFGENDISKHIAEFMGFNFIVSSAWMAVSHWRRSKSERSVFVLALLAFNTYIIGTALGTAAGRLTFGVDQAFSSRYATPSLMAFASLIAILFTYRGFRSKLLKMRMPQVLIGVMYALIINEQITHATQSAKGITSEREIAALALEMQINDAEYIEKIYPFVDSALLIAKDASEKNYSIFGSYPLKGLKQEVGNPFKDSSIGSCEGALDFASPIEGVTDYVKVGGWIYSVNKNAPPRLVRFLDKNGKVAGFAITGTLREDVAKVFNSHAKYSGFHGYLKSSETGGKLIAVGDSTKCNHEFDIPMMLINQMKVSNPNRSTKLPSIEENDVITNKGWNGSDYLKSKLDGLIVLGTLVNSDADKGTLTIRAKRGDSFFYISGPTGGRQKLRIKELNLEIALPVSVKWTEIQFSSAVLPVQFTAELIDDGDAWGEWSAIAIKLH